MPEVFKKALLVLLSAGLASAVSAADLSFVVTDAKGLPLEDTIVALTPQQGEAPLSSLPKPEVMQAGALFNPFVLPVRTGTTVSFPNFDEFRHHVYSFSEAKRFEIRLYGQDETKSVKFDKPGIVALGCNIHDNMLAYVYVTNAPLVGRSDEDGRLSFEALPEGQYTLEVWHPDQRRKQPDIPAHIDLTANMPEKTLKLSLKSVRRPQLPPSEEEYD